MEMDHRASLSEHKAEGHTTGHAGARLSEAACWPVPSVAPQTAGQPRAGWGKTWALPAFPGCPFMQRRAGNW